MPLPLPMPVAPPPPREGNVAIDNVGQLLQQALIDGGIVGIDEDIEAEIVTIAFRHANWLLAEWTRKRWLVYSLSEYQIVSTGARFYLVGDGQTVNINPRPARLEYAYLRFLNRAAPPQFPVDIPLEVVSSKEDYARIPVKSIGTISWRIFYDPQWPIGVLHPWPVPQAGLYGLHLGFMTVLPRFTSLDQPINLPPEYEAAMNFNLADRYRAVFSLPDNPKITKLARNGANTIRLANEAATTLQMPGFLRRRGRGYDIRGDTG